jgi:dolichol-phosphate mannosyltransferase
MVKLISIVIPVFRNEGSLLLTHQKLLTLFESKLTNYRYEIIFVNDGSDDGSWDELLQIKKQDEHVKLIDFSRNFGQVAAVLAGLSKATGDWVVTMSADLQDPPELIAEMIEKGNLGNEIIICTRTKREDKLSAKISSAFFYKLMHMANPRIPKGGFDYVMLSKKALEEFNKIDERNRFLQGDLMWLGFKTIFIPYERSERKQGKSQWSFSKKMKYSIDGLLNTSYLPIRLMSVAGIIFAFLGFLYALLVVYSRIFDKVPFRGYAVIVVLLLTIGGMIMLMLGIIGEYVWRAYDESRKRNIYVIREEL